MVAHPYIPSTWDAETGLQSYYATGKPPVLKRKQLKTGLHLILSTTWEFYAVTRGQVEILTCSFQSPAMWVSLLLGGCWPLVHDGGWTNSKQGLGGCDD